jgi:hypothetical protein
MTIVRQGEVRMEPIEKLPECEMRRIEPKNGVIIVGESESHHHHVLDADGVTVMERTSGLPRGMRMLYAIVEKQTILRQTAGNPHGAHVIEPGTYEIPIKREFNPFTEQARMVAD